MSDSRNIKVFLGTSSAFNYSKKLKSKQKNDLKFIVGEIERHYKDVKIVPWWETTGGNSFILEHVDKNIAQNDFCIFVFAKDTETEENGKKGGGSAKKRRRKYVPNSNVLIEIGMALSKGKMVMVLNWAPRSIHYPSDLSGRLYTQVDMSGGSNNIQTILNDFGKIRRDYIDSRYSNTVLEKYNNITVYYERSLAGNLSKASIPFGWGTKALYVGAKSASYWADIEAENSYVEKVVIKDFLSKSKNDGWEPDSIIDSIEEVLIDNVVSFGPGAGTIDQELITHFSRGGYNPFYIPIDISIPLVTKAIERVATKTAYPIPFAIVDDFETGPCFMRLKKLIESKEYKIHKRNLFSIVGVTFSNYAEDEKFFLDKVLDIMREKEDYLLLDVVIGSFTDEEFVKTVNDQIRGIYKDLIVHSIRKRSPNIDRKIEADELISKVNVQALSGNRQKSLSCLDSTTIVECSYGHSTLIILKQYDFNDFKSFLNHRFDVLASYADEENRRGVFLLSKKSPSIQTQENEQ